MADERKRVDQAGVQASAQQQGGLYAPLNMHTGQQNPAWQNMLAGAAGAMAGPNNPYMAELQRQQAAQAIALQQARAAQLQQHAAANAAAAPVTPQPMPHPGPAPGGIAGNPMAPSAPNAMQQMQQMGSQAAQQLTPEQLRQQQMATSAANTVTSDERLKFKVDRGGIERQMRRFLDSIGTTESEQKPSRFNPDSIAARALRNG